MSGRRIGGFGPFLVSAALAGGTAHAATTFTPRLLSGNAAQPAGLATGDLDGDGDTDVLVAEYTGNTVAWYQNSGSTPPVWTKRTVDPFASGPITVAAGDVDGDDDVDVFAANFNNEGIAFYENHGGTPPTWTKQVISGFWVGAWGVAAGDLDGDGDLDGIGGLTNTKCGPPLPCVGVEWYDNDGRSPPGFTARPISPGLVGASSVAAADVDGDGDRDVLAVDTGNDRVFWYENDGAHPPGWTQLLVTDDVDDPWSVSTADLDRDGDLDVLTASAEDDRVAWFENGGGPRPSWTMRTLASHRDGAIAVTAADLDGDGDPDVVAGSWNDSTFVWYESDGGTPPAFIEHVIALCGGPEGIAAARIDSDADVDLLCAGNPAFRVDYFENDANYLDADGDGVRDGLDCAPSNPAGFAVPAEVRGFGFPSKSSLIWGTAAARSGTGATYDLTRGGAAVACLSDDGATTTGTDGDIPPPGALFSYLVRAANVCGTGTYGFATSGAERTSAACP